VGRQHRTRWLPCLHYIPDSTFLDISTAFSVICRNNGRCYSLILADSKWRRFKDNKVPFTSLLNGQFTVWKGMIMAMSHWIGMRWISNSLAKVLKINQCNYLWPARWPHPLSKFGAAFYRSEIECGPMPNVMVALPNIGVALCSTQHSLADTHY